MSEIIWLSENNPVLVSEYQKIPLIEYYTILDHKIAQIKERNAEIKKQQQRQK